MQMQKHLTIACGIALATAMFAPQLSEPADAGPNGGKHGYVQTAQGKGPPPWAPAHGYRAKKGNSSKHQRDRIYYVPGPEIDLSLGRCNRKLVGQVLGGTTGAVVGSQIGSGSGRTVAIASGTIIGVLLGGEIGGAMDRADQACVDHALEFAETGQTIVWEENRNRYAVTPQSTFEAANGAFCREYTARAVIGGREQETYGTACRQPDGSWKLVS